MFWRKSAKVNIKLTLGNINLLIFVVYKQTKIYNYETTKYN